MANKVLFITDEVFLPEHNGSSSVYANVARQARAEGNKIYALSFCRSIENAYCRETKEMYSSLFSDYRICIGWPRVNGPWGKVNIGLREMERIIFGQVYPEGIIRKNSADSEIMSWLRDISPDNIYVHKLHAMQLSRNLDFSECNVILDIHDDFIEKEKQYRVTYRNLQSALGEQFRVVYPREWVRMRTTRVNEAVSRRRELFYLARANEIRIASEQEYGEYKHRYPEISNKMRHKPWIVSSVQAIDGGEYDYELGFIGSDDPMNADALLALRDEMCPLWQKHNYYPSIAVAGRVSEIARRLLVGVPNVSFLGNVENVESFYRKINASVVPLRFGTGVSIKIIEAIGFGKTVYSTKVGARGVVDSRNCRIAETPDKLAEVILQDNYTRTLHAP